MTYHDLSSCTLSADERRVEADKLCEIIISNSDEDNRTKVENDFIFKIADGGPVSVKQLFWLRDIKDKYL